jgi:cytochrome c oxidase cbb3-type subunit 3
MRDIGTVMLSWVLSVVLSTGCASEEPVFRPDHAGVVAVSSGAQAAEEQPRIDERASDEAIARGRETFGQYCRPCHGERAQGLIGPNLTDSASIHRAQRAEDYRAVIENGVPSRGMPAWRALIAADRIDGLLAYVWSVRGSNVQGGRAPQGSHSLP